MITIFFYITLFAVATFTYHRMKQEVRAENFLLDEIIELEQKLQNYRSQEYWLKQNQTNKSEKSDSKNYKQNESGNINYRQYTCRQKNRKIESQMKPEIISARGSAFYLEEIDKIA
ncbi:MAG TPA: hypothetical protein GXZ76_07295 [Clostridiaceae bacterium]|nr:hypothetical protein [Clostridiaceae bacterium]